MATDALLLDALAATLPKVHLRVYHISTRPTPVPALYSASASDQGKQKTYCESHLLGLALPQVEVDRPYELLFFAIEVLIFTTESLTTVFVSKADSTGFLDTLGLDKTAGSIIRNATITFLRFLIDARSAGPRLVLSLFARSQNQYLFPGSVEYAGKHVLDDRQLIKWWCKTLDPIVRHSDLHNGSSDTTAYILVPGCDKSETRAFFPASAKQELPESSRWIASYPMELLVPNTSAPLRCLIPRLPDDPKSRFLTDLDDSKDEKGQWKSVRTMEQFWELMAYRQECSAGRLVGFIWIVFGKEEASSMGLTSTGQAEEVQELQNGASVTSFPTSGQSQVGGNGLDPTYELTEIDLEEMKPPCSLRPSSYILPSHELGTLDAGDPDVEASEQHYDDNQNSKIVWPKETRGELIVSSEQYDTLIDHLLQLDFSTRADAEKGTSSFVTRAAELAGYLSWGAPVTGRADWKSESSGAASIPQENGVNVLTAVRKKRKVDAVEERSAVLPLAINTLSAGLVRKKAKT